MGRSRNGLPGILTEVARTAARLCEARDCLIYLLEGEQLRLVAQYGTLRNPLGETTPKSRLRPLGRAVVDRQTVHVRDLAAALRQFPGIGQADQRAARIRTVLATPLLRDGAVVGGLVIRRTVVRPFTPRQISLLKTFAAQAAIAIENTRLAEELAGRNRELTEALERETATGEILRVISGSPTELQPVLDGVAASAARLCDAYDSVIYRRDGEILRRVAHHGPIPVLPLGAVHVARGSVSGRAVLEQRPIHVVELQAETEEFPEGSALARQLGFHTVLSVPLVRENTAIGTIAIRRTEARPFTEQQVALIRTFADQAVIAIENVRLFTELQARNRELTEALEQQTATGEILRAISSSPTDAQPVFETIVRSAVRLCGARFGNVFRLEGEVVHLAAFHNHPLQALEQFRNTFPQPLSQGGTITAEAMRRGVVVHIHDLELQAEVAPAVRELSRSAGYRSALAVPILRKGAAVGAIGVGRSDATGAPRPFSDKEVQLLRTFADQAVIAIENVRLFNELQARTRDLTRSVEQLRALSDVSQAVSSTLDLDTLLGTIVARANQLAGTDGCTVYEYDGEAEEFRFRATHNLDEGVVAIARARPIRKGEGVVGRLAITREPVQIPDILAEGAYDSPFREAVVRSGARALLALPLERLERGRPASLLGEEQLIGALGVTRKTPGPFPPETVELLKTFATQSALAIHNARLFREIEDKSRQLEVASRHKSQFLANMSHELRTPLNAILGYTELIGDNIYGEVPERMREVLERVEKSGRHLLGLINDILDLSKIEAGQLILGLNDYAMQDVVRSVAAATEPLARAKGLGLEVAVPDDLPIGRADERRLMQVLLNLVGNAIKFTEVGKVAIRAEVTGDGFRVAVADTGPGIAEGEREKIFEEFQQADSVVARAKGGTGLGLAIARRIVEMHGGRLWLESSLGVGSTFSFTVPVRVEQQVVVTLRRPVS